MNAAALIMAGGRSERMRAGGCQTHKALRKVAGMSLLEHNLEMLWRSGIKEIWIAVNSNETGLLEWLETTGSDFANSRHLAMRSLPEKVPLGTIGAASLLPRHVENAVIVNVDNLTDLDIEALVRANIEKECAATIATHREPFRIPFGQIKSQDGWVLEYLEKPEIPVTICSGTSVLSRRAMSYIPPDKRMDLPGLINLLLRSNQRVACFPHSAWWIDVNDESSLARAESLLAVRSAGAHG